MDVYINYICLTSTGKHCKWPGPVKILWSAAAEVDLMIDICWTGTATCCLKFSQSPAEPCGHIKTMMSEADDRLEQWQLTLFIIVTPANRKRKWWHRKELQNLHKQMHLKHNQYVKKKKHIKTLVTHSIQNAHKSRWVFYCFLYTHKCELAQKERFCSSNLFMCFCVN